MRVKVTLGAESPSFFMSFLCHICGTFFISNDVTISSETRRDDMYFNQYSSPMGIGNIGNIGNYPNYSMPNFQNQVQSAQQQAPTQNMEWIPVNGIEGAKNHIVSRNETAWLMDNNDSKFYVKTADNLGVTTLKAYRFMEITPETDKTVSSETQIDLTEYVKRTELEEILRSIKKEETANE